MGRGRCHIEMASSGVLESSQADSKSLWRSLNITEISKTDRGEILAQGLYIMSLLFCIFPHDLLRKMVSWCFDSQMKRAQTSETYMRNMFRRKTENKIQ